MKLSVLDGTGKIWDGEDVPIAVMLTEVDKANIANMLPGASVYCVFPDHVTKDTINGWLEQLKARA